MANADSGRERLSKVPSWIMLGCIIGAIVALTVKQQIDARDAQRVAAANALVKPTPTPTPTPPPHRASLYEYEDIFDRWEERAVWWHDLTQVAFWNPTTNQYSEYVEVLRNGDDYYFRTIPKLTWPLIDVGVAPDQPLRFAEPESVRAERKARNAIPFAP